MSVTRALAFAFLAACGGAPADLDASAVDAPQPDAPSPVDAPPVVDATVDAPVDAAVPRCTTTMRTALDLIDDVGFGVPFDGTLYFVTYLPNMGLPVGIDVYRYNLGPITTVSAVTAYARQGPALMVHDGWLYIGERSSGGDILRYRPDQGVQRIVRTQWYPNVMAADATHIYWYDLWPGVGPRLHRQLLATGPVEDLATAKADLMTVGVDHLYFAERAGPMLWRVPKTGGAPQAVVMAAPQRMEVIGSDLYYLDLDRGLWRVPEAGGAPVAVASAALPTRYRGFVRHGDYFYLTIDQGLARVPFTGGELELLASSPVAADFDPVFVGDEVFWMGVASKRAWRCTP